LDAQTNFALENKFLIERMLFISLLPGKPLKANRAGIKTPQSGGKIKVVVKYKKLAIINAKPDTTKKSHEQVGRPF